MDLLTWWQTLPSKMDPVLISIGPLTIYWYSTMYLVAFGVVYILCSRKIKENTFVIFNPPYGERIELGINEFYKKIGDSLKNNYKNCTAWLISSDIENLKMIGLNPQRK